MMTNGVFLSRAGWGFAERPDAKQSTADNSQQMSGADRPGFENHHHTLRSDNSSVASSSTPVLQHSHSSALSATPTAITHSTANKSRAMKRRHDESDMDMFSASFQSQLRTTSLRPKVSKVGHNNNYTHNRHIHSSPYAPGYVRKKHHHALRGGHPLPVSRVIESLDQRGLKTLIEDLCQRHPELSQEISGLAPRVTVNSAIDMLRKHLVKVAQAIPVTSDSRGDYAYLRVKPLVDEFLSALKDYTLSFLPPNETQNANTLGFLDKATELLLQVPEWDSEINNHGRNVAFDELCAAWVVGMREASRVHGFGLVHDGWPHKLQRYNEMSNGRLEEAVQVARNELAWISDTMAVAAATNQSPAGAGVTMSPSSFRRLGQVMIDA